MGRRWRDLLAATLCWLRWRGHHRPHTIGDILARRNGREYECKNCGKVGQKT